MQSPEYIRFFLSTFNYKDEASSKGSYQIKWSNIVKLYIIIFFLELATINLYYLTRNLKESNVFVGRYYRLTLCSVIANWFELVFI